MEPYDVIVIGTGAGGSGVAIRCAKGGWNVAVVDDEPFGGTCMLRGCDPKKVFVSASELVDWHRRMTGQGVSGEGQLDWPALMQFKRTFTDPVPSTQETTYRELGIATYHGVGHLAGFDRFVVEGKELESRFFVIASGARPAPLGIPGEEHVKTSTDFRELDGLPRRIAFIGAGYIAFEFAHLARRAGAEVVMLGRKEALADFDQDLVRRLVAHTRALGVDVRLNAPATAIDAHKG